MHTLFPIYIELTIGPQLLEDHLQKIREEDNARQGLEEVNNEDEGWNGWNVESDFSDGSFQSEGWIDVDSDGDHLEISDSEDEAITKDAGYRIAVSEAADAPNRISTLATSKAWSIPVQSLCLTNRFSDPHTS
jgi:protein SDA1